MIVATEPMMVVQCENTRCNKQETLHDATMVNLAEKLRGRGWLWLLGDEAYDHACSEECLDVIAEERN